MNIKIQRVQIVDPKCFYVNGKDSKDFWLHHGHTLDDKLLLEKYCRMLPKILDKLASNDSILTANELQAYNIFLNPRYEPQLYCQGDGGHVYVDDGRHRIAMLQELGIKIPLTINYNLNFEIVQAKKENSVTAFLAKVFKANATIAENELFEDAQYVAFKRNRLSACIVNEIKATNL